MVDDTFVVTEGLSPDFQEGQAHLAAGVLARLRRRSLEKNFDKSADTQCLNLLRSCCYVKPSSKND